MSGLHENILGTIGNTPVVRINKLAPEGVELFVKLEAFNPMGSVKDRLALAVIEAAECDGSLKPGQTVIEATSGNTGIGLAMVCAQKGYPLVITMAESFSVERRRLMRFLGARVILTPASEKGSGMLAKAVELADKHGWFLCRQFENEANADVHSRTTAPEILRDFAGRRLDYWVTGAGTAGTLKGVSRVLKKERPETRIVVCEPDNAPIIGSGVPQQYAENGAPAQSHPFFRPHLMQGWTPDFIPKLATDAIEAGLIDEVMPINGAEAIRYAKELARQEGIFCGISGGATFAGAIALASKAPEGTTILCMLPDTGERYLSTVLFEDVAVDMSDEEKEIAASTPRFRLDAPPPATSAKPAAVAATSARPDAVEFVESALRAPDEPVVLFALEWCEFSWSVRKLFSAIGVPYRSIDLDSVAYQQNNWGGEIRAALRERIGLPTIPQVFVGGQHIGGATETLDAFDGGQLQNLLKQHSVRFDESKSLDARALLPTWIHPR